VAPRHLESADFYRLWVPNDSGPHGFHDLCKRHIALHALRTGAMDMNGSTTYCAQRHEVRSSRRVAFNVHTAWRPIAGTCGNNKTRPFLPLDPYAELCH